MEKEKGEGREGIEFELEEFIFDLLCKCNRKSRLYCCLSSRLETLDCSLTDKPAEARIRQLLVGIATDKTNRE